MKAFYPFLLILLIANLTVAQEKIELPFYDDFEETISNDAIFTKWTTENLEGWQYWHIIPWNGNPGQCMRFQNTDINQNDWLITKAIDCSDAEHLTVNFDVFYNGDGVKPKLFYKSLNKEDNSMSNWMELSYSLGPNENEWHSVVEIIIDNPGDIIYVAFQSEFAANQGIYFLLDNFKVKDFTPITYTFSDSSKYFTFYTTLENGENYWNEISDDVDKWYLELCSYWDRPGITPIFNSDKKTAIYLLNPNYFAEQSETELPDWKYGYFPNSSSIITKLPIGENSMYDNSYSTLVKNTLGQFNLCKHFGNNIEDYFKEGFGLFYTGYQTKRDSIVRAVEKFGQQPSLDVFNNLDKFSTTYLKDLAVSKVESSVLSVCGMQNCGGGIPEHWYSHLKYYYIEPDEKRIKLQKSNENFSVYAADQDIPYLDKIANKLEEKLTYYENKFDTIIQHTFYCVIYPNSKTADECLIYAGGYNGGSGWSGDKLDVLSPLNFYGNEADFYNFLIPHEFFHVFHFNLVKYLFELPAFYFEGLANFMAGQGRLDYLDGTEHNIYKIAYAFNHYNYNYKIEPKFENILNSQADINFNGYYNDPYYFGELFYKYFLENGENFAELKTFFLNNLDYSSIGKNYDEVGSGYMTFLKEYAGLNASIDTLSLPFSDDFEDRFKNWSYINIEGFNNYWETNPDKGFNQSKCAYIGGAIPNDDWLISDIFNTKGYHNLVINFKYRYGGTIPEIYYTTNFNGDISNSTWEKMENVFLGNQNNWNNATIEIEDPGDNLVLGIRYKSTDNNYTTLSIDNVSIDGIYTSTNMLQITNSDFKVYPNPVTSESIISFRTKTSEKVNLSVFDIHGRKISTILDKKLPADSYNYSFGKTISSEGVYFLRLKTQEGISTRKIIYKND